MDEGENVVTMAEALEPTPVLRYEHTINGKRVVLRRRVPGRLAKGLDKLARCITDVIDDPVTIAPIGQVLIESWEFEGDPGERPAYEDLDYFDEILPLATILIEFYNARVRGQAAAKN